MHPNANHNLSENISVGLICSLACLTAVANGSTVPATNRELGFQIASQKKVIDRVLMTERQVLGKWADGMNVREVEEAILLTPTVAERWCGYLQFKHKWTMPEHDERLTALLESLQGRNRLLVRLAILERKDPLDWSDIVRTKPDSLDEVTVRIIPNLPGPNGKQTILETELTVLEDRWSTSPDNLVRTPWFQAIDDFAEWSPEPITGETWDGLRRGGNRMVTVEVTALGTRFETKTGFTLVVKKGEKVLRAKFSAARAR